MPIFKRGDLIVPTWKRDWWKFLFTRCAQRILIVTDIPDSYDSASSSGLTEVIDVLEGNGDVPAAVPAVVTKASTATGFTFANASPAVTTANYDQVWLFGFHAGQASTDPDEIRILVEFMENGGGVFATGDHQDLGRPLCGALARIQRMREWSAVPGGGPSRLDTMPPPAPNGAAQTDAVPQTTFPLLDAAGAPHPLLRSPVAPINVLPDHNHESECYAPRGADLDQPFVIPGVGTINEFPQLAGQRHGPSLVAISMSASVATDKGPVTPRCFGAISAYDGHPVNRGRIVCDATWHHFINYNLWGFKVGTPSTPTQDYLQIQRYFANIADYLTPKTRIWCRWFSFLAPQLLEFPLMEELLIEWPFPPDPPPTPDWLQFVHLGRLAAAVLDHTYGAGEANRLIDDLLTFADLPETTMFVLHHRTRSAIAEDKAQRFDEPCGIDELRDGIFGQALLQLRSLIPDDPALLPARADELHQSGAGILSETVRRALRDGVDHRKAVYQRSLELLGELA